ncbi:DUF6950 family protein [Aliihoeflea sp. PC F10.4]
MTRFEKVQAVVAKELDKSYVVGKSDCFLMGLRVAAALGAKGIISQYAGRYSTLKGAQRVLRRLGHKSLVTLMATHLEPCAPAMARMGDLVVLQVSEAEHLGVCVGARFLTKTEAGLSYHDITAVTAAFRAG